MNPLEAVLEKLAPPHDSELLEGYQRYAALAETILPPEQLAAYASLVERTGRVRVLDDLTEQALAALAPDERGAITSLIANGDAALENRRVVSLLSQRGEHQVAPDLGEPRGAVDAIPDEGAPQGELDEVLPDVGEPRTLL